MQMPRSRATSLGSRLCSVTGLEGLIIARRRCPFFLHFRFHCFDLFLSIFTTDFSVRQFGYGGSLCYPGRYRQAPYGASYLNSAEGYLERSGGCIYASFLSRLLLCMTMSVSNSAFLHLYQRKSMDLHRHPNRLLYRMYSPPTVYTLAIQQLLSLFSILILLFSAKSNSFVRTSIF